MGLRRASSLAAEAGVLAALALSRRGRADAAVGVLVASVQACAAALVVVAGQGFHDVALLLFPATLVVAGLLLERRAFAVVTVGTVAFVVGIGVAEIQGLLVTPLSRFTLARNLVDVAIILGVTAVAVSLLAESVRTSLARARRNEATRPQRELSSSRRCGFRGALPLADRPRGGRHPDRRLGRAG